MPEGSRDAGRRFGWRLCEFWIDGEKERLMTVINWFESMIGTAVGGFAKILVWVLAFMVVHTLMLPAAKSYRLAKREAAESYVTFRGWQWALVAAVAVVVTLLTMWLKTMVLMVVLVLVLTIWYGMQEDVADRCEIAPLGGSRYLVPWAVGICVSFNMFFTRPMVAIGWLAGILAGGWILTRILCKMAVSKSDHPLVRRFLICYKGVAAFTAARMMVLMAGGASLGQLGMGMFVGKDMILLGVLGVFGILSWVLARATVAFR